MDLQPRNIMVGEHDEVTLIDLELAQSCDVPSRRSMGTPGFMPPRDLSPRDHDIYALMRTAIHLFHPVTPLSSMTDGIWPHQRMYISMHFGPEPLASILEIASLASREILTPERSRHGISSFLPSRHFDESNANYKFQLLQGIASSARPNQPGKLYPGSYSQFEETGNLNVYSGAAGVGLALSRSGHATDIARTYIAKNIDRLIADPVPDLMRGSLGAACFTAEVGELGLSKAIAENLYATRQDRFLPGLALGMLSLVTAGVDIPGAQVEHLYCLLGDIVENAPDSYREPVSLFDGWAGASIALSAYGRYTGNSRWHALAARAVLNAYDRMVDGPDGSLQVDDGRRILPYLSNGSAGYLLAISMMRDDVMDPILVNAIPGLYKATQVRTCLYPGLFDGMAGLVLARTVAGRRLKGYLASADGGRLMYPELRAHTFNTHDGGLYVSGTGSRRLSVDFASGNAGIICAMLAIDSNDLSWLPIACPNRPFVSERPSGLANNLEKLQDCY